MRITDLLKEEAILLNASFQSKAEAIDVLTQLQADVGNVSDREKYRQGILAREADGTTAVGDGIAIPHAKSEVVVRPGLAAATVPNGVDYESLDGKPSNLIFMIAAPMDGDLHLEVLSRLTVMLMDAEFRQALLNAKTKKEFLEMNKDLIVFDLDMYRGLYKKSFEIARRYPDLYSEITGKSAGKIMERLSAEAIENGYNFILEGTMGKSVYTLDLLQKYKVDYDIVARLLAVSREESLLSIFERYIEMKKAMGIGRMTTIESHNKKYNNFLNIAGTLERRGVEVEVFERSEDIVNPNMTYKTSGKNSRYNSVVEALIRGRNNSSKICMNNAIQRLESIKSDLQEFGEEDKYMGQIEILTKIIEQEMEEKKEAERD